MYISNGDVTSLLCYFWVAGLLLWVEFWFGGTRCYIRDQHIWREGGSTELGRGRWGPTKPQPTWQKALEQVSLGRVPSIGPERPALSISRSPDIGGTGKAMISDKAALCSWSKLWRIWQLEGICWLHSPQLHSKCFSGGRSGQHISMCVPLYPGVAPTISTSTQLQRPMLSYVREDFSLLLLLPHTDQLLETLIYTCCLHFFSFHLLFKPVIF